MAVQGHRGKRLNRATPPENVGLDDPGTFVLAQPDSRWCELVEKPGTETAFEPCSELPVTRKSQLTIHTLICFNEYHTSVDPCILHLSPCFEVLAVALVPISF